MTAKELATRIGGICDGDGEVIINSIASIRDAGEGQLTFIANNNSKYIADIKNTRASAIIVPMDLKIDYRLVIRVLQPKLAVIKAQEILNPQEQNSVALSNGVHSLAFIGKDVQLGTGVHVGPFACIEDGTKIGNNSIIYPNVYIGPNCKIGRDCQIYPNVTIREKIQIGDRVIVHAGTVIGGDGFGYETAEGKIYKVPQLGSVLIEDDVEIGANVTIDRATFDKTWIKKGTKIDNLVQIAHNVVIGENCIIVAQTGIAGSTELENQVTLAGQVAVTGHIKIGTGTTVTGRSVVTKNIPPNVCVTGHPAKPQKEDQKVMANLQRLPKLAKRVQELEHKIEELTKLLNEHSPDGTKE